MNLQWIRSTAVVGVLLATVGAPARAYELQAWASSFTTGAAHGVGGSLSGPSPNLTSSTAPVSVNTSSSVHSQVQGAAMAYADLGVIKVSASGSTRGSSDAAGTDSGLVNVDSSATWTDAITYAAAGYSGAGTAHARVLIDLPPADFIQASAQGGAHYRSAALATITIGDSTTAQAFEQQCSAISSCLGDNGSANYLNNVLVSGIGGYQDIDIPITLGSTQSFTVRGSVTLLLDGGAVQTDQPGSYSLAGLVDLSHSIYWGGITSITAANGAVISDFTAYGSSGHDWRLSSVPAVPEPATHALMLFGLSALVLLKRRR